MFRTCSAQFSDQLCTGIGLWTFGGLAAWIIKVSITELHLIVVLISWLYSHWANYWVVDLYIPHKSHLYRPDLLPILPCFALYNCPNSTRGRHVFTRTGRFYLVFLLAIRTRLYRKCSWMLNLILVTWLDESSCILWCRSWSHSYYMQLIS